MTVNNHIIGKVHYELTNHLGNVLSVVSDKPIPHDNSGTADYWLADIRQATDYSPFGVTLSGRNFTLTGAEKSRFGFNGKELDNEAKGEGNSYDFGARMHDPRLGRFLTIDPKTGNYPDLSPYQYASNSPIFYKDYNGESGGAYYDAARGVIVVQQKIVIYTGDKAVFNKLDPYAIQAEFIAQTQTVIVQHEDGSQSEETPVANLREGPVPIVFDFEVVVIYSDNINGNVENSNDFEAIEDGIRAPDQSKSTIAASQMVEQHSSAIDPARIDQTVNYFRVEDSFSGASHFCVNGNTGMGNFDHMFSGAVVSTNIVHEVIFHGLTNGWHPQFTSPTTPNEDCLPLGVPRNTPGIDSENRRLFQSELDNIDWSGFNKTAHTGNGGQNTLYSVGSPTMTGDGHNDLKAKDGTSRSKVEGNEAQSE